MADILTPMQAPQDVPMTLDQAGTVVSPNLTPEQMQASKQQQLEQEMQKIKGYGTYGQDPVLLQQAALGSMQTDANRQAAAEQAALADQQAKQAQLQQLDSQRASLGLAPQNSTAPKVGTSPLDPKLFPEDPLKAAKSAATKDLPSGGAFDPLKEAEAGYRLQQAGVAGAAKAGEDKAAADQAELETRQRLLDEQQAKAAVREDQIKADGDNAINQYKDTQQKLNDFQFHDYWADKSTGQKVIAGIAIALGGIGGAFTGKGDNKGLDVINQAIDRDLNLQKLNYVKLKDQGEASKSLYGMYMDKFKNETLASQATLATMMEASKNRLDAIASKYQSPQIAAAAQAMSGQLQAQHANSMMELQAHAMKMSAIKMLANGSAGGELPPEVLAMLPKEYSELATGLGLARGPKDAEEFNKYYSETKPLLGTLQDIAEKAKNFNKLNPKERAEMQSIVEFTLPSLVKASGVTRTTQNEIEQMRHALGDPTKIMQVPGVAQAKIAALIKTINKDMSAKASAAGIRVPTQQVPNKNPFQR